MLAVLRGLQIQFLKTLVNLICNAACTKVLYMSRLYLPLPVWLQLTIILTID